MKNKVQLASSKLDDEVEEWSKDIQIDRKHRGKHLIHSWKRMKRVLIDLWFPNDYYDILDYTNIDYKFVYSYEKQYVQNMKGQPQNQNYHSEVYVSRKDKSLKVDKKQPFSKENFEVVKKDQELQQVVELKFEDITCQNFDKEIKKRRRLS